MSEKCYKNKTKQIKKVDVHVTLKFQLALLFCLFVCLFLHDRLSKKDKKIQVKQCKLCNATHSFTALYLPCVGECKS